ncbi:MAG: ABC transporter ATP-binding protein/permease [Coriobacteriia bacterium]|nr:ABC transporter ATP-binding protein/permease [Coriobacteriia bacterium]
MIELLNVSKTYVSKNNIQTQALKKVNVKIPNNETIFIMGPSGSGKTTLLNVIGAFDKFDDGGRLVVDGKTINDQKETILDNYRNYKVGYVFQENNLLDHLTVLENVEVSLIFSKGNPKLRRKLAKEALKKVGMQGQEKKYPAELSVGQQQCVAIARAIAKKPKIILADEPTGALDSKTSEEVINTLINVSQGSTLIIASHNEKLSKKYADKIYLLEDGVLNAPNIDNVPDDPIKEVPSSSQVLNNNNIKTNRSTFSIPMAFKMAISSLLSKKVKTVLMVLAGSVGVFLVSTILAFNTGLNSYINDVQNSTLAQYPIYFGQTRDMTKVESYVATQSAQAELQQTEIVTKQQLKEKTIAEAKAMKRTALNNVIGDMMSTSGNTTGDQSNASIKNDLKSLKSFLDKNPNNINDSVSSIEYAYRTSPVIYTDTVNGQNEVFPQNSFFGSLGSGSGNISSTGYSYKQGKSSANSGDRMFSSYGPVPKNKEIFEEDETLVAGKWPSTPYELVLVLNSDGTVNDTILYELGMKNFNEEIAPLIEKYKKGEKVEFPGQYDTYGYNEFLGKTFKMINPSECYTYDSSQGVFVDNSSDPEFMKGVLANAKPLTIVGVVFPIDGSRAHSYLSPGINFPFELYEESINQTKDSAVVKAQLASPDKDVLSGESFDYLKDASKITEKTQGKKLIRFDLDLLLQAISIHPEALDFSLPDRKKIITEEEEIQLMIKILQDPKFQEMIYDLVKDGKFEEDVYKLTAQATVKYLEYVEECKKHGITPDSPKEWFEDPFGGEPVIRHICEQLPQDLIEDSIEFIKKHGPVIVETLINEISAELEQLFKDLVTVMLDDTRPGLIEFDMDKLSRAMGTDITAEDLKQMGLYLVGATSHTYLGNLADFGYDEMTDPVNVTIYPKDYNSKSNVLDTINTYNAEMKKTDQEDKFVTYVDDASATVDLGKNVVNAISAILVFFVSSAFVSSTLLIGVIFGVSTVRRRREIGVLRALGARRRDVARMFNCESALIGFFAGVVGVLLSGLVCILANSVLHLGFNVAILAPGIIIVLVVVSTLLALIAGLIPALVSSRNNPVRAIRGL